MKDIRPSEHRDAGVRIDRWTKRALDGSFKQIAGAERWLQAERVVTDAAGEQAARKAAEEKAAADAENRVAAIEQSQINRCIGLRPGMGLNIGIICAE